MLCVCLLPTSAPISLGPCDWIFVFFRCPSQKQEKLPATAAHLPAGDVLPQTFPHDSIHHSWPHPGSPGLQQRGSQPTSQGRAPAPPPPPTHMAASLELCPAVGIPTLGIVLCASQAPAGGEGKERGRQLGKGKEGGTGGASISNFIINKHFIL